MSLLLGTNNAFCTFEFPFLGPFCVKRMRVLATCISSLFHLLAVVRSPPDMRNCLRCRRVRFRKALLPQIRALIGASHCQMKDALGVVAVLKQLSDAGLFVGHRCESSTSGKKWVGRRTSLSKYAFMPSVKLARPYPTVLWPRTHRCCRRCCREAA